MPENGDTLMGIEDSLGNLVRRMNRHTDTRHSTRRVVEEQLDAIKQVSSHLEPAVDAVARFLAPLLEDDSACPCVTHVSDETRKEVKVHLERLVRGLRRAPESPASATA